MHHVIVFRDRDSFKNMRIGNAAAAAMLAARQGDGRFGPSQWMPFVGPGYWQPLLNPDGSPMLDPTPWVGGVRPFLLQSPSQFRTPGPLPLASAAYAAEFIEVKAFGSLNSAVRTPEQTHNALFWQSTGPPYPDHPSGHLCADGAHLRVLQLFFGDDVHFGVTSTRFNGEMRFFDHFSEPLAEIIEARIWSSLHFRTADVQAEALGRNVAATWRAITSCP
jgi:hypothetical protein